MGITDFVRGIGLLFIPNLKSPNDPKRWGHTGTYNHNCRVSPDGTYRNTSVPWGTNVPARLTHMPRIPVNLRATSVMTYFVVGITSV